MKKLVSFFIASAMASFAIAHPGTVLSSYMTNDSELPIVGGRTLFDDHGVEHRIVQLQKGRSQYPTHRYMAIYPGANGELQTLETDYIDGDWFLDMIIHDDTAYVIATQPVGEDQIVRLDGYTYDPSTGTMDTTGSMVYLIDTSNTDLTNPFNKSHPYGEFGIEDGELVIRGYADRKLDGDLRMIVARKNVGASGWYIQDRDFAGIMPPRDYLAWIEGADFYAYKDQFGKRIKIADKVSGADVALDTHLDFISTLSVPAVVEAGDDSGDHFVVWLESYDPRDNVKAPDFFDGEASSVLVAARINSTGKVDESVGYPLQTPGRLQGAQLKTFANGTVGIVASLPYTDRSGGLGVVHQQILVAGVNPSTGELAEAMFGSDKLVRIDSAGTFEGTLDEVEFQLIYDNLIDAEYQRVVLAKADADSVSGDLESLMKVSGSGTGDNGSDSDPDSEGGSDSKKSSGGSMPFGLMVLGAVLVAMRRIRQ